MFVRSIRYLVIALLVFSTLMGTVGETAAQNSTIATEFTQRTIEFDQSWSETSNYSVADIELDVVTLSHVDGGEVGFFFMAQQLDKAQVRDAAIEGAKEDTEEYTVVDSGEYGDTAYELGRYDSADTHTGGFVVVVTNSFGTTIVMVTGEVDIFSDAVGRVQAGVTLDGSPVLEGVDGAGLQTQLQVTDASSVPTTDELADVNTNQSETNSEAAGVSEFTSTEFGYTVAYPEPWIDGDQDIGEFNIASFEPLTIVSFSGIENLGFGGADFEVALTDTFIESLGPGGELIGTYSNQDSAVFVGISDGMLLVQQVIAISPEVAVIVTAVADGASSPETVYDNMRSITVNGIPLLAPLG